MLNILVKCLTFYLYFRLIKGTGEIVEECVSKKRHIAINKQATKGDGEYFQKQLTEKILNKSI